VFAHVPFTLVSSEKRVLTDESLEKLSAAQTKAKADGSTLTFSGADIHIVVTTGPEDDMLSYRIQGIRNPTLAVPSGAKLTILFVNVDEDMRHDIRFGHVVGDFPLIPELTDNVGTNKLTPRAVDESLQAEEIAVKATGDGAFKYFCSVRGHAKGGMWGNILVGVKPGSSLATPTKTKHVHSPDEDKPSSRLAAPAPFLKQSAGLSR
jgi:uncharacterized cupredoxin-like copper-binding protein